MKTSILLGAILSFYFVPYIGTGGGFYLNHSGTCEGDSPTIGFTLISDSLCVDSLLTIYPSVVLMDSLSFTALLQWGSHIE